MILQKTDKTPEAVDLFALKVIWKALQEDSDPTPRLAFRRLMKQLGIRFTP